MMMMMMEMSLIHNWEHETGLPLEARDLLAFELRCSVVSRTMLFSALPLMKPLLLPLSSPLSEPAQQTIPSTICPIREDHPYQTTPLPPPFCDQNAPMTAMSHICLIPAS